MMEEITLGIRKQLKQKNEPEWLAEKREKAIKAFGKIPLQGMPDSPIVKHLMKFSEFDLKKFEVLPKKGSVKLEEREENGVIVKPLQKAVKENHELVKKFFGKSVHFTESKLDALHYALWNDGVFIYLGKNAKAEINIEFKGKGLNGFFHSLIVLEENSEAAINEKYSTKNKKEFLHKDTTELVVGKNAKANFSSLQNVSETGFVFSNKRALVESNAELDFINCSFGGKMVKQTINVMLSEKGAKTNSFACFFADKKQEIDIESNATHLSNNTFSKVLSNSVVKDSSSSAIRGLLKVLKPATNSESDWHSNTLMMGTEVKANSLPTLEIDTNDVIAGHGSAFGNLNQDEMFYLRSRGLKETEAKKMIAQAYFEPIITKIGINSIQEEAREIIREKGLQ